MATLLLELGADPNICTAKTEWSPLHIAAKEGRNVIVALLASNGKTDIDARDKGRR